MLKAFIKKQYHNPLFRGGVIMFFGTFGVGVLNYGFNIIIARILDKEELGTFASLFSILTILIVLGGALNLVIIKFSSILYAKKDYPALASFIIGLIKWILIISAILVAIFGAFGPNMYRFLHLESFGPLIILALTLGLAPVCSVGVGILQGTQRFMPFSISSLVATIFKIIFAITLTLPFIPFSQVSGAMLSVPLSGLAMLAISLFFLKDILLLYNHQQPKLPHFNWQDILKYALPSTIVVLGITLLNSVDIILAKHYLIGEAAGDYAALATLGKIIFFATSAIPAAMFPIVAARHSLGEPHRKMLYASLGSVGLMSLAAYIAYQFFPDLIINLLLGEKFLTIAPYLGKFALIMGMYSLINILVNYSLSVQKYLITTIPILGSISLIILIQLNSSSLDSIVDAVFWNMLFTLISLLVLSSKYMIAWPKLSLKTTPNQLKLTKL